LGKRKNNLSGLVSHLSRQKLDGKSVSTFLSPTNLITGSQPKTVGNVRLPTLGEAKISSIEAKVVPTSIKFGTPSNSRTSTQQSGSEWGNLLRQTASGGIASSATTGLSSIAGLGGLIAGIASLFGGGGKATPPPLVEFQMPSSETQTVYVSSTRTTTYQGSAVEQLNGPNLSPAIYSSGETAQNTTAGYSGQSLQYQSQQSAQAVITALLNSSSLNDVIAEI
jgi:hypothetical protein